MSVYVCVHPSHMHVVRRLSRELDVFKSVGLLCYCVEFFHKPIFLMNNNHNHFPLGLNG